MYKTFYGLEINPFVKELKTEYCYESKDYKEVRGRLNYLKEIKGIGLFIGSSGLGKTFALRCFVDKLNKDIYKVIYISPTKKMKVFEFFAQVAGALNIDTGACYKNEMYEKIQNEIKRLVNEKRINVIIIIDDADNLSEQILMELKLLFDFQMDSKDYTTIVLVGHEELRRELSKVKYETLQQRIVVNYKFNGLSREEVKEYVISRLNLANQKNRIFKEEALTALYSASKGSPRRLNSLIINCLMIGYQSNKIEIDEEIVMLAKNEIDFMNQDW